MQRDPVLRLLKVDGLPIVQERAIHDESLVCRAMAGRPQHLPGLLCEEVSIEGRIHLEEQLALNSNHSRSVKHVSECSGPHLRRTSSEDPSVEPGPRFGKCFEVGPQKDPGAT